MSNDREWAKGPLYLFLMETFPEHKTAMGVLDIQRLKVDLGKSHEAIYKWIRAGKLKPENANAIVALAGAEPNVTALAAVGRTPPKIEELVRFVFA